MSWSIKTSTERGLRIGLVREKQGQGGVGSGEGWHVWSARVRAGGQSRTATRGEAGEQAQPLLREFLASTLYGRHGTRAKGIPQGARRNRREKKKNIMFSTRGKGIQHGENDRRALQRKRERPEKEEHPSEHRQGKMSEKHG